MKINILPFLMIALMAIIGCNDTQTAATDATNEQQQEVTIASDGFAINVSGTLKGGENLQVYFDQVFYNNQFNPVEKATLDANGNFKLSATGINAGVYRLRVNDKRLVMVLDGSESNITVNADLVKVPNLQYEISGSQSSELYKNLGRQMFLLSQQNALKEGNIKTIVDTTSNPLVAGFWTYTVLPPAQMLNYPKPEQIMEIHETAIKKISAAYPSSRYVQDYLAVLSPIKNQLAMQKIRVGVEAPNISLPSPDGTTYSLSDLRGKVVLLDFWAAWCRPCRMNNPEVVRMYNKYKNKGFTVFSVSLDGLDEMTKRRFGGDEVRAAQYVESEKQKWQNAIQQDNLTWKYHVSDLKKWDCAPAKDYGVTGIPKTYLLDKEGKIVAIDPHRTNSLESELEKLL
ncbi:MAG: redoxin domain-containing protein [Saprospiraceae bacterium]